MTEKIGCFIMDLKGTQLDPDESEWLAHPLVGGVILFARNYSSRSQLNSLCQSIRAARRTPLLIMVDQEGGRVQRFIKEFTRLPELGSFGKLYATDPTLALEQARAVGKIMASELLAEGVDLSLAPVLDLDKGKNPAIGNRAFDAHPAIVIELAKTFMAGMHQAGMGAVGKHFPGHGEVAVDSHIALPIDTRTLAEIEQTDLLPFSGMIKSGLRAVMAAHIIYPEVDALPVGFSSVWLQTILRQQLGFTGTIFSDDLSMEGANISDNYADRVASARAAGCDFTLLCNQPTAISQVLDQLQAAHHQVSYEKWGHLRGRMPQLIATPKTIPSSQPFGNI